MADHTADQGRAGEQASTGGRFPTAKMIGALLIGAVGLWGVQFHDEAIAQPEARASASSEPGAARTVTRVEVVAVSTSPVSSTYFFHGVTRPRDEARVAFMEGGRMRARAVEVGDRVEAGQVLARLDAAPLGNAVAAATASFDEVSRQREQLARDQVRAERLERGGVAARVELERAQAGLDRVTAAQDAASVQLRESRRRRRESALVAPFAGVVTDILADVGELVQAGQPIVRMAGDRGYEVIVEVSAEVAREVVLGTPVAVSVVGRAAHDPLGRTDLDGHVESVARSAPSVTGLYPMRITLADDPALRGGLAVTVTLAGEPHAATRIPLTAVIDPSGHRPFVYRVVNARAARAWLRLGPLSDEDVEVLEGLAPDDRVIVHGHAHLLDGDVVDAHVRDATTGGDA